MPFQEAHQPLPMRGLICMLPTTLEVDFIIVFYYTVKYARRVYLVT